MATLICGAIIACLMPLEPPPPIEQMPILVSWYDPALGGINCDSDCSVFADMTPVLPESYGLVAACPVEWRGRTVSIPMVGEYLCRDTGGAIHPTYDANRGTWLIPIDILAHVKPDMFGYLMSGWGLD